MATFLSIGDNLRYYEGSVVRSCGEVWEHEICRPDKLFRIAILNWRKDGSCTIGLYSPEELSNWHNLEDMLPSHTGYWIEEDQLAEFFELERLRLEITSNITIRGKNMKGRKGTFLCPFDDSASMPIRYRIYTPQHLFVELDDNVGGSGCDGLGKKGHCVMVPGNAVVFDDTKMARRLHLTK